MRRRLPAGAWAITSVALLATSASHADQSPAGTALVAGRVVTLEATPAPVRRARVTLNCPETKTGRTAITDDGGRFEFSGVSGGRCTLAAAKPAMVTTEYGSVTPGRPGAPLVIANGQQMRDVTIRMARGGVIAGVLRDPSGRPAPGIPILILQRRFVRGARVIQPLNTTRELETLLTDEDGQYRAYGLPPGDYFVAAQLERIGMEPAIHQVAEADIRRALALVAGSAITGTASAPSATTSPAAAVRLARVFYPGTTAPLDATTVTLGIADERVGVDFMLRHVPTATVTGTVVGIPADVAALRLSILLSFHEAASESARNYGVDGQGRFTANGLMPGRYYVDVATRPGRGGVAEGPWLSASTEIEISGQNVDGMVLTLAPTGRLRGQFAFDGDASTPRPARVSVNLVAVPYTPMFEPSIEGPAGESLSIDRIPSKRYLLVPAVRDGSGRSDDRWAVSSIEVNGQDVTDRPFEVLGSGDPMTFTVRLTDRPTELAGVLKDAAGRPASSFLVIAFPPDASQWTWKVAARAGGARRGRRLVPSSRAAGRTVPARGGDGSRGERMVRSRGPAGAAECRDSGEPRCRRDHRTEHPDPTPAVMPIRRSHVFRSA